MPVVTLSSKGQIVLPAALRRRLGLAAGARLDVSEEDGCVTLRVARTVKAVDVSSLAGIVKAPARGTPRRLEDFDPAALVARAERRPR